MFLFNDDNRISQLDIVLLILCRTRYPFPSMNHINKTFLITFSFLVIVFVVVGCCFFWLVCFCFCFVFYFVWLK